MRWIERFFGQQKPSENKDSSSDWLNGVVDAKNAAQLKQMSKLESEKAQQRIALEKVWAPYVEVFNRTITEWNRLQINEIVQDINTTVFKANIRETTCDFGGRPKLYLTNKDGGQRLGEVKDIANKQFTSSEVVDFLISTRKNPEELDGGCVIEKLITHTKHDGWTSQGDPDYVVINDFRIRMENENIKCDGEVLGQTRDFKDTNELRLKIKEHLLKKF